MSNLCKYTGVNGEALQVHAVDKYPYFVLQVLWESISDTVSGIASHVRYAWMYNKMEDSNVTKLYQKKYLLFIAVRILLVLRTPNSTDGNKLVIHLA